MLTKQKYMISEEMVGKSCKAATYQHKEGTTSSFVFVSGQLLLPKTLSIMRGNDTIVLCRSGRGLLPRVGQMKSQFTKAEESPYKQHKPYRVQTAMWQSLESPTISYGTIGLTGEDGKIKGDNGDLVLFQTADWERIDVAVFRGLADPARLPENLKAAVDYLKHQRLQ